MRNEMPAALTFYRESLLIFLTKPKIIAETS